MFPQREREGERANSARTLTTLPLVPGYDAVGHNVEDCKQEETNLKRQHKNVVTGDESTHKQAVVDRTSSIFQTHVLCYVPNHRP